MLHSPRHDNGRLWVLNSRAGGLGVIDPRTGRYEEVAALPGFTRGLDFHGRLASAIRVRFLAICVRHDCCSEPVSVGGGVHRAPGRVLGGLTPCRRPV